MASNGSKFKTAPKLRASSHQQVSSQCWLVCKRKENTVADLRCTLSASNRSRHEIHTSREISLIWLPQAIKASFFIQYSYCSSSIMGILDSSVNTGMRDSSSGWSFSHTT